MLRGMGIYLYPGVPNTTAVTQETDQNYGPFKTQFIKNLHELSDVRISKGLSTSLPPWIVGLFVFGGVDPVSGHELKVSAFEVGFNTAMNLLCWEKCGAAPISRNPLNNHSKVRRELGDDDDIVNQTMLQIQSTNNLSTHFLTKNGYDGSAFKVEIIKREEPKQVTVRHSKERVNALVDAKSIGAVFHATGGEHLTSNDMFLANQIKVNTAEVKTLQKKKAAYTKMHGLEMKSLEILSRPEPYKLPELKVILQLHHVPKATSLKLAEAKAVYERIKKSGTSPPAYTQWTDEEEQRLLDLTTKPVTIADTALGRQRVVQKLNLFSAIPSMSKEELDEVVARCHYAKENTDEPAPNLAISPSVDPTSVPPLSVTEMVSTDPSIEEDMDMKQAAM